VNATTFFSLWALPLLACTGRTPADSAPLGTSAEPRVTHAAPVPSAIPAAPLPSAERPPEPHQVQRYEVQLGELSLTAPRGAGPRAFAKLLRAQLVRRSAALAVCIERGLRTAQEVPAQLTLRASLQVIPAQLVRATPLATGDAAEEIHQACTETLFSALRIEEPGIQTPPGEFVMEWPITIRKGPVETLAPSSADRPLGPL
jgi:hypothetical protein